MSRWKGVEGVDLDADELFLGKLENGLATLQLADYVLAWICMEDDGVSGTSCLVHFDLCSWADSRSRQNAPEQKWQIFRRRYCCTR